MYKKLEKIPEMMEAEERHYINQEMVVEAIREKIMKRGVKIVSCTPWVTARGCDKFRVDLDNGMSMVVWPQTLECVVRVAKEQPENAYFPLNPGGKPYRKGEHLCMRPDFSVDYWVDRFGVETSRHNGCMRSTTDALEYFPSVPAVIEVCGAIAIGNIWKTNGPTPKLDCDGIPEGPLQLYAEFGGPRSNSEEELDWCAMVCDACEALRIEAAERHYKKVELSDVEKSEKARREVDAFFG